MTLMIEPTADVDCQACGATGFVDPTCEQVAAYGLLPGSVLRCGSCDGTGHRSDGSAARG